MDTKQLREVLVEEIKEAYRLIALMTPKSEVEFVATVLPNLHLRIHELLSEREKEVREEIIKKLEIVDKNCREIGMSHMTRSVLDEMYKIINPYE